MSQGYFFIALGKKYIDECFLLAETLGKQGDKRPISLLIHEEDVEYADSKYMFDKLIFFKPNDKLYSDCNTTFEKFCLYPRIKFDEYLPYEENIILDSDVLCQYNTENVWNYLTNQQIPIKMLGRIKDPKWHWGTINEVSQAYGKNVPHVHGGFFYLRKDTFLKVFFDYCKIVFYRYDEYKCKRFFRGGKVDEIIFAIAHSHFNLNPISFDEFPIMTFNYGTQVKIPSKLQTEGNQNIEMQDYIPFVHMFDKMGSNTYDSLYNKIMEK
jgi:hypothetical protein